MSGTLCVEMQENINLAQKLLIAFILLIVGYVIYKQWYSTSPEKQMAYKGPPQCEKNSDCSDGTHCADHGYCIPNVTDIGYADPSGVLGRGRRGEGEGVVNVDVVDY